MWQACPVCKGTGKTSDAIAGYKKEIPDCPVCRGHMIISEVSGLPPSRDIKLDYKPYLIPTCGDGIPSPLDPSSGSFNGGKTSTTYLYEGPY